MNVFGKNQTSAAESPLGLGHFYRAVFSSDFAVYVIRFDRKGIPRFEDANEIVIGITGRTLEQIVGQRPLDCMPEEIGQCLETQLATCFASGESLSYERSVDTPQGTRAFKTNLVPITNRHGAVEHALGITRRFERGGSCQGRATERPVAAAARHRAAERGLPAQHQGQ